MSISSVSGSSSSSYTSSTSDTSSLEKQLTKLQADLKTESTSKDDATTKEKKLAQIQQQIDLITAQIAQKSSKANESSQVETTKQETNKNTVTNTQRATGPVNTSASGGIDILV